MAKQFTGAIHRHTQRLTALLSDLLDLSRLEGAGAASALESVELGPLVDEVVDALTARASEKGQSLVSDVEDGWWVSADPSALLQFVTSLSLSDNLTFLGSLNLPVGPSGSEFGGIESGIDGRYLSTGAGLFAQIAWYF